MCTNKTDRKLVLQRAADIAENEIRWEAARAARVAVEKAPAEIVTTEERTDVAEQPCNIHSISQICRVSNSEERLFEITHSEVGHNKNPIMAADIMKNDAQTSPPQAYLRHISLSPPPARSRPRSLTTRWGTRRVPRWPWMSYTRTAWWTETV